MAKECNGSCCASAAGRPPRPNLALLGEALYQTGRDVRREKCTFCIGCCSIFLVVLVAGMAQTVISRAPLIFLREAEGISGQIDVQITPDEGTGAFLNYTQFAASIASAPLDLVSTFTYSAGRSSFDARVYRLASCIADDGQPAAAGADWPYVHAMFNATSQTHDAEFCEPFLTCVPFVCEDTAQAAGRSNAVNLTAIDTLREAAAGVGRGWQFAAAPLAPGTVILPAAVADALGVGAGDAIVVWMLTSPFLQAMLPPALAATVRAVAASAAAVTGNATHTAAAAAAAADGIAVSYAPLLSLLAQFPSTVLTLTVAGVAAAADSRGKFGADSGDTAIVVEAGPFAATVLRSMHPALRAAVTRALQSVPGIAPVFPSALAAAAAWPLYAPAPTQPLPPMSAADVLAAAPTDPLAQAMLTGLLTAAASGLPAPPVAGLDLSFVSSAYGVAASATADCGLCVMGWFATSIVANLPPAARIAAYSSSNYDATRAAVAEFGSSVLFLAGFTETAASAPILGMLEPRRFISLYLGLVLNVLLITLVGLAMILVYSLLLVNAESKTFDMAVRRMLGSRRPAIVLLLLTHAGAHALPAWALGLMAAQVGCSATLGAFAAAANLPVPTELSAGAVALATLLAWAIPGIAAVAPVRAALRHSIHEALDADRPKATGLQVTLTRAHTGRVGCAAVTVGAAAASFGFGLYYLLPLSLLSMNLALIFNFFLCVIVGMLGGLVLLSLNVELLVLRALVVALLGWWERESVLRVLWANMSAAHRARNRKTGVMFSLSVALIVFITVAATGQVAAATYASRSRAGATATVSASPWVPPQQPLDDALVAVYEAQVRRLAAAGQLSAGAAVGGATAGVTHAWGSTTLDAAAGWLSLATSFAGAVDDEGLAAASAAAVAGAGGGGDGAPSAAATLAFPWQALLRPGVAAATAASAAAQAAASSSSPVDATAALWTMTGVAQRDLGRTASWTAGVRAVSPGFYRGATFADVLAIEASLPTQTVSTTGTPEVSGGGTGGGTSGAGDGGTYSLSDMLYSPAGSQGLLVSNNMLFEVQARLGAPMVLQTTTLVSGSSSSAAAGNSLIPGGGGGGSSAAAVSRSKAYVTAMLASSPAYPFSRVPSGANTVLLSAPAMAGLLSAHLSPVADTAGPGFQQVALSTIARLSSLYGRPANASATAFGAGGANDGGSSWSGVGGSSSTFASALTLRECRDLLLASGVGAASPQLAAAATDAVAAAAQGKFPAGTHVSAGAPGGVGFAFSAREWASCLLRVMDGPALGLGAAALLPLGPAAVATNGSADGQAVVTPPSSISSLLGSVGGFVGGRGLGGIASVVSPLSLADVPAQSSFLPLTMGPGAGAAVSEMAAQLAARLANLGAARWFAAPLGGGASAGVAGGAAPSPPPSLNTAFGGRVRAADVGVATAAAAAVDLDTTTALLQLVFAVLALVAMALCFFSLSASMMTAIAEQAREVGVLRALGVGRGRIVRIYAHEAVLLVLNASLAGVAIGAAVAWTFSKQQELFTGVPVPFVLPWGVIAAVVVMAVVLGVLAAGLPAWRMLQKPVTALLRGG